VYRGTIEGKDVAVKVQRPGIAARVAADATLFRMGAKVLEATGMIKAKLVDSGAFCYHTGPHTTASAW
jgi:predicted unusual protein kinase regulating ubiquinone biosynthesis (AarF/ABC1/UbiB family)